MINLFEHNTQINTGYRLTEEQTSPLHPVGLIYCTSVSFSFPTPAIVMDTHDRGEALLFQRAA